MYSIHNIFDTVTTVDIIILTLSILAAIAALVGTWMSRFWSVIAAYVSLCLLHLFPASGVVGGTLVFWGMAAVVATAIGLMLPPEIAGTRCGMPYITIGALAGTFTGLIISQAGMIIGAVVGAMCGAIAYSRTPAGAPLGFPSARFFNFTCAKGLPVAVTACLCGLVTISFINLLHP